MFFLIFVGSTFEKGFPESSCCDVYGYGAAGPGGGGHSEASFQPHVWPALGVSGPRRRTRALR